MVAAGAERACFLRIGRNAIHGHLRGTILRIGSYRDAVVRGRHFEIISSGTARKSWIEVPWADRQAGELGFGDRGCVRTARGTQGEYHDKNGG